MILGSPLADIVQKKCHIKDAAVDARLENAGRHRQFLDQFLAFDLGQNADRLDDVLVHRVVVIDVELHHRDDGFEFGDEGRQHSQFVHPAQGALRVAMGQHQIKKNPGGLGV